MTGNEMQTGTPLGCLWKVYSIFASGCGPEPQKILDRRFPAGRSAFVDCRESSW
jgi:hypothetical protein